MKLSEKTLVQMIEHLYEGRDLLTLPVRFLNIEGGNLLAIRDRAAELEKEIAMWRRGMDCSHCLRWEQEADNYCPWDFSLLSMPLNCRHYQPDGTWQNPARQEAAND